MDTFDDQRRNAAMLYHQRRWGQPMIMSHNSFVGPVLDCPASTSARPAREQLPPPPPDTTPVQFPTIVMWDQCQK